MKLHFLRSEIQTLADHVRTCKVHKHPYHSMDPIACPNGVPGLLLVGDHGIYFGGNGEPHLMAKDLPPRASKTEHARAALKESAGLGSKFVAYARECDPRTNDDGWWEVKQASFGGDDGIEFFPLSQIDAALEAARGKWLEVDVTPQEIRFFVFQKK